MDRKFKTGQAVEVKDANSFTGRKVVSSRGEISMNLGMTIRWDGGRPEPKYMVTLETCYGSRGYEIPESYLEAV